MTAPAGIRINLLPHRAAARRRRERRLLLWLASGALAGLLPVLLAGTALHLSIAEHEQRAQQWRQASTSLAGALTAVRQAQTETAVLAVRQRAVMQLQAQRNDWVLLLAALARAVPAGVTLHGLRQHDGRLRVEGRAAAQEQVVQLLDALAQALPPSRPQLLEVRATQEPGVELVLQLQWPAPSTCTAVGGASC